MVSNVGHDGKKVCAACPVARDCLTYAIVEREEHGIWGGCGESKMRFLARVHKDRQCDSYGWQDGCQCHWCVAVEDAIAQNVVFNANGEGATHGNRVTYARGCRCLACRICAGVYSLDQRGAARASLAVGVSVSVFTALGTVIE